MNQITNNCKFEGYQVAMYVDRNGCAKGLADNAVATLHCGSGTEIRGAVIIALEDNRYDTHSFHFQEYIDNVFAEISKLTNGLARRV